VSNRTSADVIPLCSASVRTKSSASRVMTLVITHAGHRPAKIGKDRIGKIAISMIVIALIVIKLLLLKMRRFK